MPRVVSRLFAFGAKRTLPARDAYALWADTYPPVPHNPLMQAEQAVVTTMIGAISALRALDVGTGSGRYLPLLASTGARVVVGVDFSMPMLRTGFNTASDVRLKPDATRASDVRRKPDATSEAKTKRVCGDACRLPFQDASFDLVSSSLMAGDVADLGGWIGELARVLAPGGHLVYSDFHPDWAARGWRRTFKTADGRSFEVSYFPHTIAEHLAVLAERSFDVRTIREPRLAPPDAVARPGRSRRRDVPVVVAFHAIKRGSRGPSRLIKDHLPGGASRLAALLLPKILPVFSVVAPCHPGAALRNLVLVQPRRTTSRALRPATRG